MNFIRVQIGSWDKFNDSIGNTSNDRHEKEFVGAERKASYIMPKNGLVPANMAVSASVITSGPSMDLFEKEEHGLTYTAFSRATRFSDVGIFDGFEASKFLIKIPMHKKMGPRLAEENR